MLASRTAAAFYQTNIPDSCIPTIATFQKMIKQNAQKDVASNKKGAAAAAAQEDDDEDDDEVTTESWNICPAV